MNKEESSSNNKLDLAISLLSEFRKLDTEMQKKFIFIIEGAALAQKNEKTI